jgi:hypothetical protein
MTEPP